MSYQGDIIKEFQHAHAAAGMSELSTAHSHSRNLLMPGGDFAISQAMKGILRQP
jgi:hypothetical protein